MIAPNLKVSKLSKLLSFLFSLCLSSAPAHSLWSGGETEVGDGGPAIKAKLTYPVGVALDGKGNLYIADTGAHRIRRVDAAGIITSMVGTGKRGFSGDGGPATNAEIFAPHDMIFDVDGNLFFTDSFNDRIRKVDTRGVITTIAGTGKEGFSGDGGPAVKADLNNPQGIAIGREGNILVADSFNHVIRKIDRHGIITTVAGSVPPGFGGDGARADKALLSIPYAVEVAPDGKTYISDGGNSRIRKVDSSGIIQHVVGSGASEGLFGAGFRGDGGAADAAQIYTAADIAFDAVGNLYISDSGNNRIRAVIKGVITTIAGTGKAGFSGDGGKAIQAEINTPQKLVLDKEGNIYFADRPNHRARKIDTSGIITTVAGSGKPTSLIYEPGTK